MIYSISSIGVCNVHGDPCQDKLVFVEALVHAMMHPICHSVRAPLYMRRHTMGDDALAQKPSQVPREYLSRVIELGGMVSATHGLPG